MIFLVLVLSDRAPLPALYALPYWTSTPPSASFHGLLRSWIVSVSRGSWHGVNKLDKKRPVRACARPQERLVPRSTDAVVAQWQSTPLVRVRSRVQSSLTAPSFLRMAAIFFSEIGGFCDCDCDHYRLSPQPNHRCQRRTTHVTRFHRPVVCLLLCTLLPRTVLVGD